MADIAHLAYIKLCTIARAFKTTILIFPRFTKDEYRYTPWFLSFIIKKENLMKWTKRIVIGWFFGAVRATNGAYCGLAYAYSYNAWSSSTAAFGSRLAVKSSEIAIYFGEQFKELWKDFLNWKKVITLGRPHQSGLFHTF